MCVCVCVCACACVYENKVSYHLGSWGNILLESSQQGILAIFILNPDQRGQNIIKKASVTDYYTTQLLQSATYL